MSIFGAIICMKYVIYLFIFLNCNLVQAFSIFLGVTRHHRPPLQSNDIGHELDIGLGIREDGLDSAIENMAKQNGQNHKNTILAS